MLDPNTILDFPKISIVTPSYNQAGYLEATIKSILDQGYPNLEYIIIDGGSTDGSVEIIEKYSEQLAYWVSEKDNGLYDAINKGFAKSSGEVMAWLNSDDMYHAKSLFTIGEIFVNFPQVKWLTGIPNNFDEQGRCIGVGRLPRWSKYKFFTNSYKWIQQESTCWRRSLWEEAGARVDSSQKLAGDFELWLRFFRYTQLYSSNVLIGGFRMRTSMQKSLEQMEQYEAEAHLLLKRDAQLLSSSDKNTIKRINRLKAIIEGNWPIIRDWGRWTHQLELSYEYPPVIAFNRITQQFEVK